MTSVVIVGGGVIGLSIAWRAAQAGMSVTLADPAPGRGASHAAAGMLAPAAEAAYAEKDLFALGLRSLRRFAGFSSELTELTGLPTGFRQAGTLQVAYDADDMSVLIEAQELQDSFGMATSRLSARECRAAEPMLDPAVRGGVLTEEEGAADPRLLIAALLAAAQRCGAALVPERVTEILYSEPPGRGPEPASVEPAARPGQRVSGIRLASGRTVPCEWVVIAAGWESSAIAGMPPDALPPIRPVKGQILRLRASGDALLPGRCIRGLVRGARVYLLPRENRELVVGATQEELGPDVTVTAGGVWELLRDAHSLVPGITELEFAEATAGLRPGTPDNAPVLGPAGPPGLVLATGHFRGGVLLAPVTAELTTEYLHTQRLPAPAAPFTVHRLHGPDGSRP
ncbi:MAG TPA: glycine oxidase ThiO [Streptosporangiaceae bacterium]|nr:glycine oxidase ThiO [Streptosporangiaceae bacterium]